MTSKICYTVLLIGVVGFVSGCLPHEYTIHSEAMAPTVRNGQLLSVLSRRPEINSLARYDLLVIKQPTEEGHTSLLRVIGLPGESIAFGENEVFVNGRRLDLVAEFGLNYQRSVSPAAVYGLEMPYVVPANKVFMLGDNFRFAQDSRIFGPVPAELLIAKVEPRKS